MKFIFSLLLFNQSQSIFSLTPILIQYSSPYKNKAELTYSALKNELLIPDSLIEMHETGLGCEEAGQVIWQICWDEEGLFFPSFKSEIIKRSYQVFWKENKSLN